MSFSYSNKWIFSLYGHFINRHSNQFSSLTTYTLLFIFFLLSREIKLEIFFSNKENSLKFDCLFIFFVNKFLKFLLILFKLNFLIIGINLKWFIGITILSKSRFSFQPSFLKILREALLQKVIWNQTWKFDWILFQSF